MLPPLKIYYWPNFEDLTAEYSGMAVAIAGSLEDAIRFTEEDCGMKYEKRRWGEVTVLELAESAFVCRGGG